MESSPGRSSRGSGLLLLLALLAMPPRAAPAEAELVLTVDLPDRVRLNGLSASPELAGSAFRWRGLDLKTKPVTLGGKMQHEVEGSCWRLEIGLTPGRYRVAVACAGRDSLSGPMSLWIDGAIAAKQAPLPRDGFAIWEGEAELAPGGEAIEILGIADVGRRALVHEVKVTPLDGKSALSIRTLLPLYVPVEVMGATPPQADARSRLRDACDYLVRQQVSTGFFDLRSASAWETGTVARCLLLGARLLDDPRYAVAARRPLEFFLQRQEEDGGFCADLYDPANGRDADPREPVTIACLTRNVADLSVAAASWSLAAPFVADSLGENFIAAQRRFVERFAASHRRPDGQYANGRFSGREYELAYSAATAAQVTCLVTLAHATREEQFLRSAEASTRALLTEWNDSGRPLLHPYNRDAVDPVRPTQFHDLYYVLDAFLWVRGATKDRSLRDAIDQALRWYVSGREGLLATLVESPRAFESGVQDETKGNAMLGILTTIRGILNEPKLDPILATLRQELLAPSDARRRGICAFPYDEYGRKAVIATAFAGLSYAELTQAGAMHR
ncbi:MAG: hypothetical protein U0527_09890 [Candidatus Eisenbacteria bacterium]